MAFKSSQSNLQVNKEPAYKASDHVSGNVPEFDADGQIIDSGNPSSRLLLHNFTATTDPNANDDAGDGYLEGSLWYNTNTQQLFVLTDSTTSAAVWKKATITASGSVTAGNIPEWDSNGHLIDSGQPSSGATLNNFTATVDPVGSNDSTQGYTPGSLWFNTTSGALFILTNDPGGSSAEWTLYNDLSKNSTSNKDMAAETTSVDGDLACATAVADTVVNNSDVAVLVNGILVDVGSGKEAYFSSDGGTTPKTSGNVLQGDLLYWNGSVAGFELDSSVDKIDFEYLTSAQSLVITPQEQTWGWVRYKDDQYTVATPLGVAATTDQKLFINKATAEETYKPSTWPTLWDSTIDEYIATESGSSHCIQVSFTIEAGTSGSYVECWLSDTVEEYGRTLIQHLKGTSVAQRMSFNFIIGANGNVISNNLTVYVRSNNNVDLYDTELVSEFRKNEVI